MVASFEDSDGRSLRPPPGRLGMLEDYHKILDAQHSLLRCNAVSKQTETKQNERDRTALGRLRPKPERGWPPLARQRSPTGG